jgi:hypothetical protein
MPAVERLNADVWTIIALFLQPTRRLDLRSVCSRFRTIFTSNALWEWVLREDFPPYFVGAAETIGWIPRGGFPNAAYERQFFRCYQRLARLLPASLQALSPRDYPTPRQLVLHDVVLTVPRPGLRVQVNVLFHGLTIPNAAAIPAITALDEHTPWGERLSPGALLDALPEPTTAAMLMMQRPASPERTALSDAWDRGIAYLAAFDELTVSCRRVVQPAVVVALAVAAVLLVGEPQARSAPLRWFAGPTADAVRTTLLAPVLWARHWFDAVTLFDRTKAAAVFDATAAAHELLNVTRQTSFAVARMADSHAALVSTTALLIGSAIVIGGCCVYTYRAAHALACDRRRRLVSQRQRVVLPPQLPYLLSRLAVTLVDCASFALNVHPEVGALALRVAVFGVCTVMPFTSAAQLVRGCYRMWRRPRPATPQERNETQTMILHGVAIYGLRFLVPMISRFVNAEFTSPVSLPAAVAAVQGYLVLTGFNAVAQRSRSMRDPIRTNVQHWPPHWVHRETLYVKQHGSEALFLDRTPLAVGRHRLFRVVYGCLLAVSLMNRNAATPVTLAFAAGMLGLEACDYVGWRRGLRVVVTVPS